MLLLLLLLRLMLLRVSPTALLLRLLRRLTLPLSIFLPLPLLLLEGAEAGGLGSRPRNVRGWRFLLYRAGASRRFVTIRRIADGDGFPLDPQSRRLGGSLRHLRLGRLATRRQRRGRLGTRWSILSAYWGLGVGGTYKINNKGR